MCPFQQVSTPLATPLATARGVTPCAAAPGTIALSVPWLEALRRGPGAAGSQEGGDDAGSHASSGARDASPARQPLAAQPPSGPGSTGPASRSSTGAAVLARANECTPHSPPGTAAADACMGDAADAPLDAVAVAVAAVCVSDLGSAGTRDPAPAVDAAGEPREGGPALGGIASFWRRRFRKHSSDSDPTRALRSRSGSAASVEGSVLSFSGHSTGHDKSAGSEVAPGAAVTDMHGRHAQEHRHRRPAAHAHSCRDAMV